MSSLINQSISFNIVNFVCSLIFLLFIWSLFSCWRKIRIKSYKTIAASRFTLEQSENIAIEDLLLLPEREMNQDTNNEIFALQILKEAIKALNNNSFLESQEKFYSLEDYLTKLNEITTSYVLKPAFHPVINLFKEIEKELLLIDSSLTIEFGFSELKIKEIRCDSTIIKNILSFFTQEICYLKNETFTGSEKYIKINLSSVKINYVKDSGFSEIEQKIIHSEPALCITLSESLLSDSSNDLIKPIYIKSLDDIRDVQKLDVGVYGSTNGIEAHYGVYEFFDDPLVRIFVIPTDLYNVRPIVLDLLEPISNFYNYPAADELENVFWQEVQNLFPNLSPTKITKALDTIKVYHSHQTRKTGEPFYMHPLSAAIFLLHLFKNENSENLDTLKENIEFLLLGALLHDILEDTVYTKRALLSKFGHKVYKIIAEVSKMRVEAKAIMVTEEEAFNALVQKDPLSLTVKLFDRYHNLLTIVGHKSEKKKHLIAQETLNYFMKSAEIMKFTKLHNLLQEMCCEILQKGTLEKGKFIY